MLSHILSVAKTFFIRLPYDFFNGRTIAFRTHLLYSLLISILNGLLFAFDAVSSLVLFPATLIAILYIGALNLNGLTTDLTMNNHTNELLSKI